ncbi:MAG TPA: ferritin-like domain-containing protein [Fimbriimonadaceae bacterium]|nr:ferritin-like domain-containing protein [Fimbriimonadaceae bacterium]
MQELAARLNDALSAEYQAVVMYTTYAAAVQGPYRPQLRAFFQAEIPDELGHAQFLADKVVALGMSPSVEVREVPQASDPVEMLRNVRDAEQEAIRTYKRLAEAAHELGEQGLATRLETMVEDETEHFEETDKILAGW